MPPDIVNPQIADAVTQANVTVLGDAPALSLAELYQATAQALSNAAHNAVSAQQSGNTLLQATTAQSVALILGASAGAPPVEAPPTDEPNDGRPTPKS